VLKGFIVGLALTIIIGQVPKLLGVEKTPGNFFGQAWGVIKHLPDTHPLTLLIGASSLILVLALKRWSPLVPGSLVAVLLGIGVVTIFGLADQGVKIVGHIDSGLPAFGLPQGVGWRDFVALFGPAIGVVLIGVAEGLGAAKTYAAKAGYQVNANRELAGLGAANLGQACPQAWSSMAACRRRR
jgi:sulfate permease, SulP family